MTKKTKQQRKKTIILIILYLLLAAMTVLELYFFKSCVYGLNEAQRKWMAAKETEIKEVVETEPETELEKVEETERRLTYAEELEILHEIEKKQ